MAPALPGIRDQIHAARWLLIAAGSFAIIDTVNGRDSTPRSRKARAIVAYLASRPGTRVSRERMAELLWGDRGEAQARASLRQAVLEIRKAAPGTPAIIRSDHEHVWINEDHVRLAGVSAEELSHGEFVPFEDLDHVSREFDEWLEPERTRRTRDLSENLRAEAEELLASGHEADALPLIEAMERLDPFDEEALRLAMRVEFRAGHAAAIEQRFRAMAALLREELGVEPSPETKALHDELIKRLRSDGPETAGSVRPPIFARMLPKQLPANWSFSKGRLAWPKASPRHFVLVTALIVLLVMSAGLWWAWSRAGRAMASEPVRVAVLPFRASGVNPALADGFSEALLSRLADDDQFRVTGQTSAWQYKDRAVDLRQVGRDLGVDYVVEGSVRRSGDQTRVTAALVRTKDRGTVWRREFVAKELQPELERAIKAGIAGTLGLAIDPAVPPGRSKAYPMFLRAKSLVRMRTSSSTHRARELLREAVRLDPNHAPSWSLTGLVLTLKAPPDNGDLYRRQMDLARAMIERAMRLDPKLADAHASMALNLGFEDARARQHLARALQLNPNDPQTVYWWGIAEQLAGNLDASEKATQRALALDPLWRRPAVVVAEIAVGHGDMARADQILATMRRSAPEAATEVEMAIAAKKGDYSHVVEIGMKDLSATNDYYSTKFILGDALLTLGYHEQAALIAQVSPTFRALLAGRPANVAALLVEARRMQGDSYSLGYQMMVISSLTQARRFADMIVLYRAGIKPLDRLRRPRKGDTEIVWTLGPNVALALLRTGNVTEANRLLSEIDDLARRFEANRRPHLNAQVAFAMADAMRGRRESAIVRLEKVASLGWFTFDGMPPTRLRDFPAFEGLRGNPRFDRLDRICAAKLARERAEAAAFI